MRPKSFSLAAAIVAALATASPAAAQSEPIVFADAKRGDLRVVSGVLVSPRAVELRGVWLDDTVPCSAWRGLRVEVYIERTRGQTTRVVQRRRQGAVRNCAEGGPNFGFGLTARQARMACPNGRWRPGVYTFGTRTIHRATGLEATATVLWENTRRC